MKQYDKLKETCSEVVGSVPQSRLFRWCGVDWIVVVLCVMAACGIVSAGGGLGVIGEFPGWGLFWLACGVGLLWGSWKVVRDIRIQLMWRDLEYLLGHVKECVDFVAERRASLVAANKEYGRTPDECAPQLAHVRLLEDRLEQARGELRSGLKDYAARLRATLRFDEPLRTKIRKAEDVLLDAKELKRGILRKADAAIAPDGSTAAAFGGALAAASVGDGGGAAAVAADGGGGGAC